MGIGYVNHKQSAERAINMTSPGDPNFAAYVAFMCRGVLPIDPSCPQMEQLAVALPQLRPELRPLRIHVTRAAAAAVLTTGLAVTVLTQQSALANESVPGGIGHSLSQRAASISLHDARPTRGIDFAATAAPRDSTPILPAADSSATDYTVAETTSADPAVASFNTTELDTTNLMVQPTTSTAISEILEPTLNTWTPRLQNDLAHIGHAMHRVLGLEQAAAADVVTAVDQLANRQFDFSTAPITDYTTLFAVDTIMSKTSIDFADAAVASYTLPLNSKVQAVAPPVKKVTRVKKHNHPNSTPVPVPSFTDGVPRTYPTQGSSNYEVGRAVYIANYFVQSDGLTDAQGSGIAGDAIVEAYPTLDQNQHQNGGPGMGLFQWTIGGRWSDEERYAKDHGENPLAADTELAFADDEMHTDYSVALTGLRLSRTPAEAAIAFEVGFERAGSPALTKRADDAEQVYQELEQARSAADHTA